MQRVIHSLLWRNKNAHSRPRSKNNIFKKGFPLGDLLSSSPLTPIYLQPSVSELIVCVVLLWVKICKKNSIHGVFQVGILLREFARLWAAKFFWEENVFEPQLCSFVVLCFAFALQSFKNLNRKGKRKKEWVKKTFSWCQIWRHAQWLG